MMASVSFITAEKRTYALSCCVSQNLLLKLIVVCGFEKSIFMTRVHDTLNFIKVKHGD